MTHTNRYVFLFVMLVFFTVPVKSQHFIGLPATEVASLMRSAQPRFKLDKSAVNHTYKYLKYVDKITEQTILFFLSDDDICTYVRWMSDYSNLNDMIGMLNKSYNKAGTNVWSYNEKGESFTVKLEEDDWYFTVTFRKN